MKTWIAKVSQRGREPFWMGSSEARDRAAAKIEARRFVDRHLDCAKIVCIAEGRISVQIDGPEIPIDE